MPLKIGDIVASQAWAIMPESLNQIIAIANRENDNIEAIESKLGRPLDNTRTVTLRGNVALIPVTGPIFRYANMFTRLSGATSLEVLAQDFQKAQEDVNVKTIVLNIDSPGGMAAGISEFAQMVKESKKKVIAYVDNQAASAAYWIASAADEMVLSKTGMVGSVGAVLGVDTRKREGYLEIVSSQSPKKRPDLATQEGQQQIQSRIDALAQVFVEDVAGYRGVSVEKVLSDFGQGDMRLGEEAVSLGMADRVSTLDKVIAGLTGNNKGVNQFMSDDNNNPVTNQPVINREYLDANHSDLVSTIRSQGFDEGVKSGAENERQRVQDVMAQSMRGHEKLIQTLAFDGKTTGGDAAIAVLSAEKAKLESVSDDLEQNAPPPVPAANSSTGDDENKDDTSSKSPREVANDARALVDRAEQEGRTLSYADAVNQVSKQG